MNGLPQTGLYKSSTDINGKSVLLLSTDRIDDDLIDITIDMNGESADEFSITDMLDGEQWSDLVKIHDLTFQRPLNDREKKLSEMG
jgi:hypothetical protein